MSASSDDRTTTPRGPEGFGGFSFLLLCVGLLGTSALLSACGSKTERLPAPAPAVQPVYIPVPVPCEIEQIEPSPLPSAKGIAADIYEAVTVLLADREVLLGDRKRLVAANRTPCPGGAE